MVRGFEEAGIQMSLELWNGSKLKNLSFGRSTGFLTCGGRAILLERLGD